MSNINADNSLAISIRRQLIISNLIGLGLVAGIGIWATLTNLSGAVISHGSVVVDSYVKKVQHPTGGVIGEINVKEGGRVSVGDVLVRLDAIQTKTQLAIISKRLNQLHARRGRLEAERDEHNIIKLDTYFSERIEDVDIGTLINSEKRLFDFRTTAREGKKKQLRERIAQYEYEIVGLQAQQQAYERGITVINAEIAALRPLLSDGFVNMQRLNALETQVASFGGERGEKIAYQAQVAGKIAETKLQILSIDQDFKTEVSQELREVESQIDEFSERKIAAEDELKRIDIIAPHSGIIHQLSVHTIGGVITPADIILQIVPENDHLAVEVQISPHDIDQVIVGQHATLRMAAFNQRTTPELNGIVSRIAAELTHDEKTGLSWYVVRVDIPPEELKRLKGLKLLAGMPVEAFIQTTDRTALSYFLKPLADQMYFAFREE